MSGYDGPTTDPWAAIKQRQAREHEAAQEANRPGRTQTFQSVRKLWNAILELRVLVDAMTELFNRMPQNDGAQIDTTGWSIDTPPVGGAWTTVATATINRPATTNRAAVMAVGAIAASADSGEFGNFAAQARILINGVPSVETEGTVEVLVNTVRTSVNLGFFHELVALTGPTVTIELQARGRYSDYPVTNRASLSVSVGFTRVG